MRFQLNQTVVYWAPATPNDFGRPTTSNPVQLRARWEDKQEQRIDASGDDFLSAAVVYLDTAVRAGGFLFLGKLVDLSSGILGNPRSNQTCREIGTVGTVPSLRNTQSLVTAYLK